MCFQLGEIIIIEFTWYSKDWLMEEVKRGRSMKIINKEYNFVILIVGGIIPQALGTKKHRSPSKNRFI